MCTTRGDFGLTRPSKTLDADMGFGTYSGWWVYSRNATASNIAPGIAFPEQAPRMKEQNDELDILAQIRQTGT